MRRQRSSTRDDFDKVKDTLHKLRTENRKLRKENSQLRKELNRAAVSDFDLAVEVEEEGGFVPPAPVRDPDEAPTCPKCKSEEFSQIVAGRFLIKACRSCGFRKRVEVK